MAKPYTLPPAEVPQQAAHAHRNALACDHEGLPANMRNVPAIVRFRKKPDLFRRTAARWQPFSLAQQLPHVNAAFDLQSPPRHRQSFHEHLAASLLLVVQQQPLVAVQRKNKLGTLISAYESRPFTADELHARDLCLELLLAYDAPVNGSTLLDAARHQGREVFQRLLAAPNVSFLVYPNDREPHLLHSLAAYGQAWALPLLVKPGHLPVDGMNTTPAPIEHALNETALGSAARCGQMESCKVLLELGADPRVMNAMGLTPAQEAMAFDHTACATFLREHEQAAWRADMKDVGVEPTARRRL